VQNLRNHVENKIFMIIVELKEYIKNVLGVEIKANIAPADRFKRLPLYFKAQYKLYEVELYDKHLTFIEVLEDFTTDGLRKHVDLVKQKFNTNAVAIFNQLEPYKRLRLIEKKIPFIVPGKQMFMPNLLIDLREYGTTPPKPPKAMTPAAQILMLYHFQIESLEGKNLKAISKKLTYNATTISRAVRYLTDVGLCTLEGGRERLLKFNLNKKDLWGKAIGLMSCPVKKTHFYRGAINDINLFMTNNNALAHYTDLNNDKINYYAVAPGYTKYLDESALEKTAKFEGNICIEEWKYSPKVLSKKGYVDPLSLYLCFRENEDERVEMALEQLLNKVAW
jgi:hypothetical protein